MAAVRYHGAGVLVAADRTALRTNSACWSQYAEREETRREHLLELRAYLGLEPFGLARYHQAVHATSELA